MEKPELYRDLIKQQIRRYVESFSEGANSDVQELEVFDDERGHSQVSELRKSSEERDVPFFGSQPISLLQNEPRSLIFPGSSPTSWSPGLIVGGLNQRTCTKCGSSYRDDSPLVVSDRCFMCRATTMTELVGMRLSS